MANKYDIYKVTADEEKYVYDYIGTYDEAEVSQFVEGLKAKGYFMDWKDALQGHRAWFTGGTGAYSVNYIIIEHKHKSIDEVLGNVKKFN